MNVTVPLFSPHGGSDEPAERAGSAGHGHRRTARPIGSGGELDFIRRFWAPECYGAALRDGAMGRRYGTAPTDPAGIQTP